MKDYYVENENSELGEYGIEFFAVNPSAAGIVTAPHVHSSLEFIYVKSGVFEITVDNGQTLTAYPDSLLIFRANTIHTIVHTGNERSLYYVLKISPTVVFNTFFGKEQTRYAMPFLQKRRDDSVCIGGAELSSEIVLLWEKMIEEHAHRDETFFYSQRINASRLLLLLVKSSLSSVSPYASDTWISERSVAQIYDTVDFINDNFASDITPLECAERLHVSFGYFAKLFKSVMGKTFKEYLCGVRMSRAHTMLLYGERSVTDVASACGYSNLSYFVAEYKKVFGTTPRLTKQNSQRVK